MIKECRQCKKEFETEQENKFFCSESCRQEALAEIYKNIDECLSCQ